MKMWNTTNGLGQQVTWYSEDEIKQYKDALSYIKKIAKKHCKFCKDFQPSTFDIEDCFHCEHNKIFKKIDEVQND
jgi:coenzyme F420-reducing hydrogenase beta subunit